MRRVDRAIFAIFLLALVADVARSYASTPVSSELSGSLILSAASQFQGAGPAGVVPAYRRSFSASTAKRAHAVPAFATWSKRLLHPTAEWSQVALLQPAAILTPPSVDRADALQLLPPSSLDRIERAGNPAP